MSLDSTSYVMDKFHQGQLAGFLIRVKAHPTKPPRCKSRLFRSHGSYEQSMAVVRSGGDTTEIPPRSPRPAPAGTRPCTLHQMTSPSSPQHRTSKQKHPAPLRPTITFKSTRASAGTERDQPGSEDGHANREASPCRYRSRATCRGWQKLLGSGPAVRSHTRRDDSWPR